MSASDLSPKQKLFVQEYLKDLNATQAAIRVGYAEKTANREGTRLLSNAVISAAVDEAIKQRAERIRIDAGWVLERLIRNAERAAQAEPVRDNKGNETGEYQYEGGVVNKALELIGKHVGMFVDKLEITGSKGGPLVTEIIIEHHATAEHTPEVIDPAGEDREREASLGVPSGPESSVA